MATISSDGAIKVRGLFQEKSLCRRGLFLVVFVFLLNISMHHSCQNPTETGATSPCLFIFWECFFDM